MSFVTAVRDYVDLINANFDSFHQTFGTEMTLAALTKGTLLYFGQSIKIAFLYIFTLQWLRDLAYLPVIIPEFTLNTFRETFIGPLKHQTFTELGFFGTPTLLQNKFVVGFFNSFFASLPLTFAHLVSARQFYVKGWRAAAATSAGMIVGHIFFLAAVLFGWRPVLIPWLQFEPGTFLLALVVTVYTIKSTFGRNAFQQMTTIDELAKTAGIGFLLMLCDQGVLFKYLSTLTAGLEPTYLEPVTGTASSLSQQHLVYIAGFFIGSVLFTAFFFWLAALLRQLIATLTNLSYVTFATRVNSLSRIVFVATFSISLSFYGLDFLVTKPLGYVPYDRALIPGTFASYTLEDKRLSIRGIPPKALDIEETQTDYAITKEQKKAKKQKSVFNRSIFPMAYDFDLSSFDRGILFRRAMASSHETRSSESYRIPTSEFWSSRTVRKKAPRGMFTKVFKVEFEKADRRFFKPIKEKLGLDVIAKEKRKKMEAEQSELDARLRARQVSDVRRIWLLANLGSRQKFDQFTVYDNVNSPVDPYVRHLTKEQASLLRELDTLLKVPTATDYAANIDRVDELLNKCETLFVYQEPPIESRFSEVEDMTSKIFEGQTSPPAPEEEEEEGLTVIEEVEDLEEPLPTEPKWKQIRRLSTWPYLFGYLHEQDVGKAIKQRVLHDRLRQNPYMQTLFRTDIDTFLARQPQDQMLTSKEEAELYFKRVMLKNMVHTNARVRRIFMRNPVLREAFDGGKSFANKVYNHQFNGTYKVVRQLMRVDLDPLINASGARVMKYDMPLFKGDKDRVTSVHEELFSDLNTKRANPRRSRRGLKADQHILRQTNIRPLYAGWDDNRRAFVLTNRFLPNRVSSRAMRFNAKYPEFAPLSAFSAQTKSTKAKKIKRIAFTTWPISRKIAKDPFLLRTRPNAFMAEVPSRYDVRYPSKAERATKKGRVQLRKAHNARFLIEHFMPNYDFRPLEIIFEEADKPHVDVKQAKENAANRLLDLPSLPDYDEYEDEEDEDVFFELERWPAGFIVHNKADNAWWLEEKPPLPFVDRGGYVWPGHEQLKINIRNYLPQWKAPTFSAKNPFAQAKG